MHDAQSTLVRNMDAGKSMIVLSEIVVCDLTQSLTKNRTTVWPVDMKQAFSPSLAFSNRRAFAFTGRSTVPSSRVTLHELARHSLHPRRVPKETMLTRRKHHSLSFWLFLRREKTNLFSSNSWPGALAHVFRSTPDEFSTLFNFAWFGQHSSELSSHPPRTPDFPF